MNSFKGCGLVPTWQAGDLVNAPAVFLVPSSVEKTGRVLSCVLCTGVMVCQQPSVVGATHNGCLRTQGRCYIIQRPTFEDMSTNGCSMLVTPTHTHAHTCVRTTDMHVWTTQIRQTTPTNQTHVTHLHHAEKYLCVCVCVCVRACMRVIVCVIVCVHVYASQSVCQLLLQPCHMPPHDSPVTATSHTDTCL